MAAKSIDHIVLNVSDVTQAIEFYRKLGFEILDELAWKNGKAHCPAIKVGETQKINIHASDTRATPKAVNPIAGSGDICFVWEGNVDDLITHLKELGVTYEFGPISRRGALGKGTSVYIRDPDGNLLEFLTYG